MNFRLDLEVSAYYFGVERLHGVCSASEAHLRKIRPFASRMIIIPTS